MHTHRPYNIPISQIVLFQGRLLFYTIILTIPVLKVPISFALQAPHWNVFRVVEEVSKPQRKPMTRRTHKGTPTTKRHGSMCQFLRTCSVSPKTLFVVSSLIFISGRVANQSILPKNDLPKTLTPFFGWNGTNPHRSTKEEKKNAPSSTFHQSESFHAAESLCFVKQGIQSSHLHLDGENGLDSIEWIIWAK